MGVAVMRFRGGFTPRTLPNRAERPNTALIHESLQSCYFAFVSVSGGLGYCAHVAWLMLSSVVDCVSSWDEEGWDRVLSGLMANLSRSRVSASILSSCSSPRTLTSLATETLLSAYVKNLKMKI